MTEKEDLLIDELEEELAQNERNVKALRNRIIIRIEALKTAGPSPAIPHVIDTLEEVLGYIDKLWPSEEE